MSVKSDLKRSADSINENDGLPAKCQRTGDVMNIQNNAEEQKSSDNDSTNTSRKESCDQNPALPNIPNLKNNFTMLKESDVGIAEYIRGFPELSAVVKERYSDFIVNEVNLSGNVIRLTNLLDPDDESDDAIEKDALTDVELKLVEELTKNKQTDSQVSIDVTNKDKQSRRKIHELIRETFKGLESTTEDLGESKYIIVKKRKAGKCRKYYPPQRGNYTHFVLYKENRDTMDAVSQIASMIRQSPKSFSYAGTKDKRGKTVQCVCAHKVAACDLLALNDRLKQIKIGNISYKKSGLKLGDLSGNHFVLILRQLKGNLNILEEAVASLSSHGFINYYGMQRFGTTSVATHHVGRSLLMGKWREAVDLILQSSCAAKDPNLTEACKTWFETRNARKSAEKLHNKSSIAARLLVGLAKHKANDLVNSLNAIPRNTRLMYIHSYQSYIWNKVLSRRIKKFGLKPQVGDLVLSGTSDVFVDEGVETAENLDIWKMEPEVLTSDKLSEHSIYDIILPLPGYCINYPENEIKTWYVEFLKEDGMDLNSFKSKVRAYSLTGAYRKIVVKPTNVKWELLSYDDNSAPLVLSDWEVLNGEELPPPVTDGGKHTALKLEFFLPSSSYATMALREVLQQETY